MARVRSTQYRVVNQYKDEAGHRLRELDSKTVWYTSDGWDYLEADCPKCPEPEPVECKSYWHLLSRPVLQERNASFCPRCGKRLREE